MFWEAFCRFWYKDGTHSVRTFLVYARTRERAVERATKLLRDHVSQNEYRDALLVRITKQEKTTGG